MNLSEQLLGDIVAGDFRMAAVLSESGLDFCCGGKKTLGQACSEKGINSELIEIKLKEIEAQPVAPGQNFNEWRLDFLCDYIVNTHHTYVKKTLPDLLSYTKKIAEVHGDHHPELKEVAELFSRVAAELTQHLKNEEEVLFPAIKSVLIAKSPEMVAVIHSEISRMHGEHEFAGGAMDHINEITKGYMVPGDGCNTYHVTFKFMKQFEDDLHIHVHLENNILFKQALQIS